MSQAATTQPLDRFTGGNYCELAAVIAAGGIHVALDLAGLPDVARLWNVAVGLVLAFYIGWRIRQGWALSDWGIRTDNFWSAMRLHLAFAIPAIVLLVAIGIYRQRMPPPPSLLLAVATYPAYGVAQQFMLQNLVVANVRGWIRSSVGRALVGSALFAASHIPLWPVVGLSFVGGLGLTIIYERRPNLWAAGWWHGVLAALAFYFVLGRTPAALFLQWISRLTELGA